MDNIKLLKDSRKVLELTQKELALRLGVNAVTVRRWETGARSPDPEVFKEILGLIVERAISIQDRKALIAETVKELKNAKNQ